MTNTITDVIPKILAQGLPVFREAAIMPRLVARTFDSDGARKGSTIEVPVPSYASVDDVTPAAVPPTPSDSVFKTRSIALDKWKKSDFHLTDQERMRVLTADVIPMAAAGALRKLGNQVNSDILAAMKLNSCGIVGATSTDIGASFTDVRLARVELNKLTAPDGEGERRLVLSTEADGRATGLADLINWDKTGQTDPILTGSIGRKLGMDFFRCYGIGGGAQVAASAGTGYVLNGNATKGATSITVDGGSGTIKAGTAFDLGTADGVVNRYVLAADLTAPGTVAITTAIRETVADNGTNGITIATNGTLGQASAHYVQGYAFHRDAVQFVNRPFERPEGNVAGYGQITDPLTGITLRLQVIRGYMMDIWVWDIQYGCAVIVPEWCARMIGTASA